MSNYILEGKEVREASIEEWGRFLKKKELRQVGFTKIDDEVEVSTVFLGIEMQPPKPGGLPILFETMIFGGENDQYTDRYETWDEAEAGHQKAINLCYGK